MGMISFFKEAGEKLFGKKPEMEAAAAEPDSQEKSVAANAVAAKAIGDYIRTQSLPVDALTITFDGASQVVTVSGLVASQEIKEKIVLCCGNVSGVAGVQDEIETSEPADQSQYHLVVRGDTLSAIAKTYYGNANAYPKIFEANKPMLAHPDKIYPGQLLRIPPQV